MERDEITVKVKLRLDELGPFEEGQVIDSGRIDAYLDDSGDRLQKIVPPYIVTPSSFADASASSGGSVAYDAYTGYVPLPADFLKLVSFKMENWAKAVTRAITENDPLYKKQNNIYVRGSHIKPVAVFRTLYGVGKVLDYYSVQSGLHTVEQGLYLASKAAEDLDEILIDPLAYLVAEAILNAVGEFDAAKAANAKVFEWINARAVI